MKSACLIAAVAGLACVSVASAQTIITDSFTRTVAPPGWGSVDNALVDGMTGVAPADYITGDAAAVEVTGDLGFLTNNRVILDYNLALDPQVIAGGGVTIQYDVAPDDGATGREFAGLVLADSNSLAILGGPGAINGGNVDSRFGLAVRNSGTVGFRQFQDDGDSDPNTGSPTLNLVGNPNAGGGINEFIFDQGTFDDYVAAGATGPFQNEAVNTIVLTVLGDFTAGSTVTATATIDGVAVDFDPSTAALDAAVFEWGDNDVRNPDGSQSGVIAPQLYLDFLGFNGPHGYDNLKISAVPAIPEPTSLALAGLAGLGLVRRRR